MPASSRPPVSRTPCRFYGTAKGCAKGDSCPFMHVDSAAATASSAPATVPVPPKPHTAASTQQPTATLATQQQQQQQQPSSLPKKRQCRFFNTPGGCKRGDECPYAHEVSSKPNESKGTETSSAPITPSTSNASSRGRGRRPPGKDAPKKKDTKSADKQQQSQQPVKTTKLEPAAQFVSSIQVAMDELKSLPSVSMSVTSYPATAERGREWRLALRLKPSDPDFAFDIVDLGILLVISLTTDVKIARIIAKVETTQIPAGFASNVEKDIGKYFTNEVLKINAMAAAPRSFLVEFAQWLDSSLESILQKPPAATVKIFKPVQPRPEPQHQPQPRPQPERTPVQPTPSPQPEVRTVQQPQQSLSRSTRTGLEADSERRATETRQIERRFRSSLRTINSETWSLDITISDPDYQWKKQVPRVTVQLTVPIDYPAQHCMIALSVPADCQQGIVTDSQLRYSEKQFADHAAETVQSTSVLHLLNWLDRQLPDLLTVDPPVSFVQQQQMPRSPNTSARSPRLQSPPPARASALVEPMASISLQSQQSEQSSGGDDVIEHDDEEDSEDNSEDESDGDDDEDDDDASTEEGSTVANASIMQSVQPEHRGIQLRLPGVQLTGTDVVALERINLLFRCKKCSNTTQAQDTPVFVTSGNNVGTTAPKSVNCSTCRAMFAYRVRPDMLTASRPSLAYIDVVGPAEPCDLLPTGTTLRMLCSNCDHDDEPADSASNSSGPLAQFAPAINSPVPGQPAAQTRCRKCHNKMSISIQLVRLVRIGIAGGSSDDAFTASAISELAEASTTRKAAAAAKRDVGIVPGQPLPQKGACKHYGRSYRWFRFPCCGMAYPCDECHDAAESHEGQRAKSMICGYCSREQPAGNSNCKHCNESVMKQSDGRGFWEGGSGTRNRSKMSRKDNRKYAGIGKTMSRAKQEKIRSQRG
ncbi:hypothetical protein GQ42DRAFT_160478 [Ramicandelaber brevisporus]|nr:hypothetical protein GQ42DRAFT_160478 [Ramicandelaber brevisporus]